MKKNWIYQEQAPLTIGLWRPIEVEIGFIKDYIKRSGYEYNGIILF